MCAAAAEQLRGNRANTHTHTHRIKPHRPTARCFWTSRRTDRLHPTSAGHVCFSSAGRRLFLLYNLDDWKGFVFFLLPSPNPGLHRLHRVTTGCIKVLQSTLAESCSLSLKTTKKRKDRQTAAVIIKSDIFIYFPQLSHAHVRVLYSSPCSVPGTPPPDPPVQLRGGRPPVAGPMRRLPVGAGMPASRPLGRPAAAPVTGLAALTV